MSNTTYNSIGIAGGRCPESLTLDGGERVQYFC
jgi:hypothetical protein